MNIWPQAYLENFRRCETGCFSECLTEPHLTSECGGVMRDAYLLPSPGTLNSAYRDVSTANLGCEFPLNANLKDSRQDDA